MLWLLAAFASIPIVIAIERKRGDHSPRLPTCGRSIEDRYKEIYHVKSINMESIHRENELTHVYLNQFVDVNGKPLIDMTRNERWGKMREQLQKEGLLCYGHSIDDKDPEFTQAIMKRYICNEYKRMLVSGDKEALQSFIRDNCWKTYYMELQIGKQYLSPHDWLNGLHAYYPDRKEMEFTAFTYVFHQSCPIAIYFYGCIRKHKFTEAERILDKFEIDTVIIDALNGDYPTTDVRLYVGGHFYNLFYQILTRTHVGWLDIWYDIFDTDALIERCKFQYVSKHLYLPIDECDFVDPQTGDNLLTHINGLDSMSQKYKQEVQKFLLKFQEPIEEWVKLYMAKHEIPFRSDWEERQRKIYDKGS